MNREDAKIAALEHVAPLCGFVTWTPSNASGCSAKRNLSLCEAILTALGFLYSQVDDISPQRHLELITCSADFFRRVLLLSQYDPDSGRVMGIRIKPTVFMPSRTAILSGYGKRVLIRAIL